MYIQLVETKFIVCEKEISNIYLHFFSANRHFLLLLPIIFETKGNEYIL